MLLILGLLGNYDQPEIDLDQQTDKIHSHEVESGENKDDSEKNDEGSEKSYEGSEKSYKGSEKSYKGSEKSYKGSENSDDEHRAIVDM